MSEVLSEIFSASEEVLSSRLRAIRAALHHAGLKGAAVEEEVRAFLRDILPTGIGVGTGIVVDSLGNRSRQMDIICFDEARTPKFFSSVGSSVFPVECVYFAFEVKTRISASQLEGILENARSLKSLEGRAYNYRGTNPLKGVRLWGEEVSTWHPIYGVIALEQESAEPFALKLGKLRKSCALKEGIDAVLVLGDAAYLHGGPCAQNTYDVDFLPRPGFFVARIEKNPLLAFFAAFSSYYTCADIGADFRFVDYARLSPGVQFILSDQADRETFESECKSANGGNLPGEIIPLGKKRRE